MGIIQHLLIDRDAVDHDRACWKHLPWLATAEEIPHVFPGAFENNIILEMDTSEADYDSPSQMRIDLT
jgi:hypothetical protein